VTAVTRSRTAPAPRPSVAAVDPYDWEASTADVAARAGLPLDAVVRFDTNTCPWPGAGLDGLAAEPLNEYPDPTYAQLTAALARHAAVAPAAVTIGAGADEILALLATAYLAPGDPVVMADPTYSMFGVLSEIAGAEVRRIPSPGLRLDRHRMLEAAGSARLTWLCNPNNPTGELLPPEFVGELADAARGVVVVDEAYHEFCQSTAVPLAMARANVVVVRTLSKAFGLAGARVGYAVAGPGIAATLARVRPPGSISGVSAALAVHALERADEMRARVRALLLLRQRLAADIEALDMPVQVGAANFLLVSCPPGLAPALAARGLVVRTFPVGSPLHGWMRITVRAAEENGRLVAALRTWGLGDGR